MDKDHTKYDYFTAEDVKREIVAYAVLHGGNRNIADNICKWYDTDKEFIRAVYRDLCIERIDFQVNHKIVETYWRRAKPIT